MKRIVKQSIALLTAVTCLFISSCVKKQPESTCTERYTQHQEEMAYACPMHPEIKGNKGDKCAKCTMELEQIEKVGSGDIEVTLASSSEKIKEGVEVQLRTSIQKDGKNAALDIIHEKKIHMLVVDEGLTWFDHIHPVEQADGSHLITETFPHGGTYYVFADFKPSGSAGTVHKSTLEVSGNNPAVPDTLKNKWVSNVDGYTLTLINGNDFQTNRPQHLGIQIQKDGKNIASHEMETYLGAIAHVVIIGMSDKKMLHVHPGSNEHVPIHGETHFEKPGIYRMWVQFQLEGVVHTADFTVNVKEGLETKENHHGDHTHHQH